MVSVGRQVKSGIARAVVREVLTDRALNLILPLVLGPLMSEIHREISVLTGQPVPPRAPGGSQPDLLTEDENQLIGRLQEYQERSHDEDLPDAEEQP